mmetsp:Transcript_16525/g.39527  ORF Transcript_16525/g.39527 Transcript_16525/m.39527 type:complete len:333 (-) Transcript_16525:4135-5133(-)
MPYMCWKSWTRPDPPGFTSGEGCGVSAGSASSPPGGSATSKSSNPRPRLALACAQGFTSPLPAALAVTSCSCSKRALDSPLHSSAWSSRTASDRASGTGLQARRDAGSARACSAWGSSSPAASSVASVDGAPPRTACPLPALPALPPPTAAAAAAWSSKFAGPARASPAAAPTCAGGEAATTTRSRRPAWLVLASLLGDKLGASRSVPDAWAGSLPSFVSASTCGVGASAGCWPAWSRFAQSVSSGEPAESASEVVGTEPEPRDVASPTPAAATLAMRESTAPRVAACTSSLDPRSGTGGWRQRKESFLGCWSDADEMECVDNSSSLRHRLC